MDYAEGSSSKEIAMRARRDDESSALTVEVVQTARRIEQLVAVGSIANVLDTDTCGVSNGVRVVQNELDGGFGRGSRWDG